MTNSTIHSTGSSVYPGLYTPTPETEMMLDKLKKEVSPSIPGAAVNIIKKEDHIRLEIAMPGFNREDIFIGGYENLLSVFVLPATTENTGVKNELHEIPNDRCLQKYILVPGNTDGAFGSARYKDGILTIYIPTTQLLPGNPKTYNIVVY